MYYRHSSESGQRILPRKSMYEVLEGREMFSASAFGLGDTAAVTLSFVPDGTDVAGNNSALFAKFNQVAAPAVWKRTILDAFQTWAQHTNGDIGLVSDGGMPVGTPGAVSGDKRFGDIRISAMPMGQGVMALSIPQDVVSGTWVGDVIYNTDAVFESVADLFAVTMHEAGNVFGLSDNQDPASPMYSAGVIPLSTTPTANDLQNLQKQFGERSLDRNELQKRNDSIKNATRLQTSSSNGFTGATPAVAYGDISAIGDVDVFRLDPVDDYRGPMRVILRTSGISQLAPKLVITDRAGNAIAAKQTSSVGGGTVEITLPQVTEGRYYARVLAATGGLKGIGGYSITAVFSDLLETSDAELNRVTAGGAFRFFDQRQIQTYLNSRLDGTPFVLDDQPSNDDPLLATKLETTPGFADSTRYQSVGTLTTAEDVDLLRFDTSQDSHTWIVRVRGLDDRARTGELALLDDSLTEIEGTILVRDDHDLVIQFTSLVPSQSYFVRLFGGTNTPQNYELTVASVDEPIVPRLFAAGVLSATSKSDLHSVRIEPHQLVHVILTSERTGGSPETPVTVTITGEGGVHLMLTATINSTRTAQTLLLEPGNYVIEVKVPPLNNRTLTYTVTAVTVSDPLGVLPNDPITNPVADCPSANKALCTPGDVNQDRAVNFADYVIFSANYGSRNADWRHGDFTGEGWVDFSDYLLLSNNYGRSNGLALVAPPTSDTTRKAGRRVRTSQ